MNFFNKKALVVLAALSFGGSMLGASWKFGNHTAKPLMIDMQFNNQVYWYLVEPNKIADFSWSISGCYSRLRITEYDKDDAKKTNGKLANLPYGAYGSSSTPSGCQASAQEVQKYFNGKTWHVPCIMYPHSINLGFLKSTIDGIGSNSEMVNELIELSNESHNTPVTKFDFGFGKLLQKKLYKPYSKDILYPDTHNPCLTGMLSIYNTEFTDPNTKKKESVFIFVHRTN